MSFPSVLELSLISLSNSSAETPYSFANAIRLLVLGSDDPFSHFDTASSFNSEFRIELHYAATNMLGCGAKPRVETIILASSVKGYSKSKTVQEMLFFMLQ